MFATALGMTRPPSGVMDGTFEKGEAEKLRDNNLGASP